MLMNFYGRDAYLKASTYLSNIKDNHYGLIAYRLGNTLTPNGSAKRGVCKVNENNELITLVESSTELIGDLVKVSPLDGSPSFETSKDTIASMNMLLFTPSLFKILEEKLPIFLENNKDNLEKCEFLIPIVLNECVKDKKIIVDVVETNANWYGVTYKEDKELVVSAIKEMINKKIYNNNLYGGNNEKDKTLLIMAAGMGSRFGGLKQIEQVGPSGEFIIAILFMMPIKAGFTKVVFIVKKNFMKNLEKQ